MKTSDTEEISALQEAIRQLKTSVQRTSRLKRLYQEPFTSGTRINQLSLDFEQAIKAQKAFRDAHYTPAVKQLEGLHHILAQTGTFALALTPSELAKQERIVVRCQTKDRLFQRRIRKDYRQIKDWFNRAGIKVVDD